MENTVTELNEQNLKFSEIFLKNHSEYLKAPEHKIYFFKIMEFYENKMKDGVIDNFDHYLSYWMLISESFIFWKDMEHFLKKDLIKRLDDIAKTKGFKLLINGLLNNAIEKNVTDIYETNLCYFYNHLYLIDDDNFKSEFYKRIFRDLNYNFDYLERFFKTDKDVEILLVSLSELRNESKSIRKSLDNYYSKHIVNVLNKRIGFSNDEDQSISQFYTLTLLKLIPDRHTTLTVHQFFKLCKLYIEFGANHSYILEILRATNLENIILQHNRDGYLVDDEFKKMFVVHRLEDAAKEILKFNVKFKKNIDTYIILDFDIESQHFIFEYYKYHPRKTIQNLINYVIEKSYFIEVGYFLKITDDYKDLIAIELKI